MVMMVANGNGRSGGVYYNGSRNDSRFIVVESVVKMV